MSDFLDVAHKKHLDVLGVVSMKVVELDGFDDFGKRAFVEIQICEVCGYIVSAVCSHEQRSWNDDETKLECNFCGADLT